jgi:hypothetical protein
MDVVCVVGGGKGMNVLLSPCCKTLLCTALFLYSLAGRRGERGTVGLQPWPWANAVGVEIQVVPQSMSGRALSAVAVGFRGGDPRSWLSHSPRLQNGRSTRRWSTTNHWYGTQGDVPVSDMAGYGDTARCAYRWVSGNSDYKINILMWDTATDTCHVVGLYP